MAKTLIGTISEVDKNAKGRWLVWVKDPNCDAWIQDEVCMAAWDDFEDRNLLEPGNQFRFHYTEKADSNGTVYNNLRRISAD
jgi:hypothetical protein